VSVCEE